jgi:hypothetical protein
MAKAAASPAAISTHSKLCGQGNVADVEPDRDVVHRGGLSRGAVLIVLPLPQSVATREKEFIRGMSDIQLLKNAITQVIRLCPFSSPRQEKTFPAKRSC